VLDSAAVRHAAELLRMEDARAIDTALVAQLLGHPLPQIRGRAALAAGRIRDRQATPLLLRALADADASVRAQAAFALGELADSSAVVVTALSRLALSAADPAAAEAAAALGQIGVADGRAALDALLATDNAPAALREAALLAAWRLPRAASTSAAVLRWAAHQDAGTRWRAVYALGRSGGVTTVPPLLVAATDADPLVRSTALRGLRAALVDSAGLRPSALTAIMAAAADPHPHVRVGAIRLLPGYRQESAVLPLLMSRLRDVDANVAVAAAQALGEVADPAAGTALGSVVADAALLDGFRAAALAAWVRTDAAAATAEAAAWADSSRWLLRMNAARALQAAGWAHAAPTLERLARDAHPLVAAEALNAARTTGDSVPALRRLYLEQLGAGHPLVRAAAARGLERMATAADLDMLLHAYDRARQDSVRDAAIAVATALGAVARAGAPVNRVFLARFGGTPPTDPAVYRAVERHIGAPAGWPRPETLPAPRPLDFYADVVRSLVAPQLAGEAAPRVAIGTSHGEIVLELAAAEAPLTVHNFLSLVERGYYAGTRWHRVVPNFVIQDGDPRGDGSGGPGYAIRDEINPLRYLRGTLGMALSGPDTGGSQFFITHSPQPHLDGGYTVFGRVVAGMEAVDRVVQDEPVTGFRRVQ
jgi:cyclophilin family peptidyl-prolyl cis-trans isomerase/HEAT repeat protein